MFSKEILKGTIKPIILKLIADEGKMYGYQITQRVKDLTLEKINITEGALYPALHKLVDEGLLTTEMEMIGNRERRYYSLSSNGKSVALAKIKEIRESISILSQLFDLKITTYDLESAAS